jgi:hypothetical protein
MLVEIAQRFKQPPLFKARGLIGEIETPARIILPF